MNYDYTYPSSDPVLSNTDIVLAGAVLLFLFVFVVIAYAVEAYLLSRIFKKAGVPQWVAWVPVYNMWKLMELGKQQGFWAVFMLIPFVGIIGFIYMYIAMYHIGKKLGKEDWFILVAIFLPIVWMIWLGFDDSQWPAKKKPSAKKSVSAKTTKKKA